jgi:hypothetical protein
MFKFEIEFYVPFANKTYANVNIKSQMVFLNKFGWNLHQYIFIINNYSYDNIPLTIVENIIKVIKLTIGMYKSSFFICYLYFYL